MRSPLLLSPSSYGTRSIRLGRNPHSLTKPTTFPRTPRRHETTAAAATPSATTTTTTTTSTLPSQIIRPLVPPPTSRSGPLLTRLPDRALPPLESSRRTWLLTLPIFLTLITASSLAIFNYQKSSSSTVNSVLYALRTNPAARDLLGDEIYFASQVPWIRGELNQLHGNIDIRFWVKGTKGTAETKFVSVRKKRDGFFQTLEWSLKLADGRVVQLLEAEGARDPMARVVKE